MLSDGEDIPNGRETGSASGAVGVAAPLANRTTT
jgi:hypothetical protein